MINYEIIKVTGMNGNPDYEYVSISCEDGSFESFPVDEENTRYQQFLLDLEAQKGA